MKILIVDDSNMDRNVIINALKNNGIENEILEVSNGEEAIKVLSAHYKDICLILLDWQMSKIDGLEFMRGIVKVPETASIPIVMVTASGSEESQKCARRVNPKLGGYIVKPFKPEKLVKIIEPFLN